MIACLWSGLTCNLGYVLKHLDFFSMYYTNRLVQYAMFREINFISLT